MSRKLLLHGLMALTLVTVFTAPTVTKAATLGDLDFGTVIQVKPTDTTMISSPEGTNCGPDGTSCAYTDEVLPLRFVKMQARDADGGTIDNPGYTYWMFLDNYCWWGNAQCMSKNNVYPNWQAWNGAGGAPDNNYSNNISMVMGLDNSGTANPNAAAMQNNNILNTLDNFYGSLPDTIGGLEKADATDSFAWDMRGNSWTSPPVSGWYNPTNRPWQTGTYDPTPSNGNDFAFTGDYTTPVMTSRIGLISFTEWQGGTTVHTSYVGQTPTNGSGGSFCQARFGTDCTNAGSYELFFQTASVANPLPRYPWTRSPHADGATLVWSVGGVEGYSLTTYNASDIANTNLGVSPTLWLSSDISITSGEGTYDEPFCVNEADCVDEIVSEICTATDDPNEIKDIGSCAWPEYDGLAGTVGIAQLVSATIKETLSISTEDSLESNLIPTPSGTEITMTSNIFVSTNNASGYYLTLENTSGSEDALVSGGNTIASIGSTESPLTNGSWGYKVGSMTGYLGVPLKGNADTINSASQEVALDQTIVTYGVKADTAQPTGTYTTTVLYTAISGNP